MKKKHVIPVAVLSSALFMGTLAPVQTQAVSTSDQTQVQQQIVHNQQNKPFFNKEKGETSSSATEKSAQEHLKKNKKTYNISTPDQSLKQTDLKTDDLGMTHVTLQQTKNGVPVEGHLVKVHYNEDEQVEAVNGQFNTSIEKSSMSTKPSITKSKSIATAEKAVSAPDELVESPTAELVVYPFNDENYLAYKVNVNFLGESPGNWFVYVDAQTGNVIDQYNTIMHASYKTSRGFGIGVLGDYKTLHISKDMSTQGRDYYLLDQSHENLDGIYTLDAENQWVLPGKLFSSSDAAFRTSYERPAADAHYNSEEVYKYFLEEHDRNSIDGEGMPIVSTVHFGEDYNNAFWNGQQMTYGDGDGDFFIPLSAGLDVAAHEMTHGVTTFSAGLKYRFQSGALNEAFSDIFGALVDKSDWEMGEDIMGAGAKADGRTALRSLSDPSKFPVNEAYVPYGDGNGMYPSHMDEYYDLPIELDNGGVHINSSIINHAAYLTGQKIGRDKLGHIYYRALTVYLMPDSDFDHAREVIIQSAVDLYGEDSPEAEAAAYGLDEVGITG
ncbi:peptidase M4 family protein [Halobacillus halophilus]|uniref:M4 family metallopeptidase n=1 Tax=Halobacillus halophilus TaxID=1570 RepID=UPI0013689A32|nr:M4 family metallopeptidase [Halobacillus halophilus]MYL30927.1 peptidase M4 family protein [Halobacillus halophilus]